MRSLSADHSVRPARNGQLEKSRQRAQTIEPGHSMELFQAKVSEAHVWTVEEGPISNSLEQGMQWGLVIADCQNKMKDSHLKWLSQCV